MLKVSSSSPLKVSAETQKELTQAIKITKLNVANLGRKIEERLYNNI